MFTFCLFIRLPFLGISLSLSTCLSDLYINLTVWPDRAIFELPWQQIFGDVLGYFEKYYFISKNCCGYFEKLEGIIGLLFVPSVKLTNLCYFKCSIRLLIRLFDLLRHILISVTRFSEITHLSRLYLDVVKNNEPTLGNIFAIGQNFTVLNGRIWTNNLAIWSRCFYSSFSSAAVVPFVHPSQCDQIKIAKCL